MLIRSPVQAMWSGSCARMSVQQALQQRHVVDAVAPAPPVHVAGDPLAREFPQPGLGQGTEMRIGEVGEAKHRVL